MKQEKSYENYPWWMVAISNLVQTGIYVVGLLILYPLGFQWMIAYLIYAAFLELRLLRNHCVDCYYYGKRCAFGRGNFSSMLFRKGDPKKFGCVKITWKDIFPDFMLTVIPIIVGAFMLVMNFSWLMLALVIAMGLLGFPATGIIRGSIACRHCKQRELGCPAEQLFAKKKKM
jgi:hypothetical protein